MNRKSFLIVFLTIAAVSFGQDKAAPKAAAPEIPPGPSMKETEAWIKREFPLLAAYSVVHKKNDDSSKPLTYKHRIESAVLSDGRLTIRRTEVFGSSEDTLVRLTYTETVTLKDVIVSQIKAVEETVPSGYTYSRPSYHVPLLARGQLFTSQMKQEGYPAQAIQPKSFVLVRVSDLEAANRVADVLKRAAILCGAPPPVPKAVATPADKTEPLATKPASSAKAKMTNADVIQLVSAGLSEPVVTGAVRQAAERDFDLTPTGLIALKKAGVTDAVIVVMLEKVTPAQAPSVVETKSPPKYDPTLAEPKKPAAQPESKSKADVNGLELLGLFTEDLRPAVPVIIYLAKIRNESSVTRIVTLQWLDMYGQAVQSTVQVGAGQIATLELSRNKPVERKPIDLRISSSR